MKFLNDDIWIGWAYIAIILLIVFGYLFGSLGSEAAKGGKLFNQIGSGICTVLVLAIIIFCYYGIAIFYQHCEAYLWKKFWGSRIAEAILNLTTIVLGALIFWYLIASFTTFLDEWFPWRY